MWLNVFVYPCHTWKSEGGLYVNIKLHFRGFLFAEIQNVWWGAMVRRTKCLAKLKNISHTLAVGMAYQLFLTDIWYISSFSDISGIGWHELYGWLCDAIKMSYISSNRNRYLLTSLISGARNKNFRQMLLKSRDRDQKLYFIYRYFSLKLDPGILQENNFANLIN